jgi:hypothetical protein
MPPKPPRKRPARPQTKSLRTFRVGAVTVRIRESAAATSIDLNGQAIPGVRKLPDGQYHTEFFPFRSFATADELGRDLAEHLGSTFVLKTDAKPGASGKMKGPQHGHS